MDWHSLDTKEVLEKLDSTEKGIGDDKAKQRLAEYGPNELEEKAKKHPVIIFLNQFKDFMILVLLAAAVVSGIAGDISDAIIIIIIVLLNAVVGFIQEYRAEKSMEALKKMAATNSQVIRDGKTSTIPTAELVPGDVVALEAGNVIPADLRIIESHSLRVNESAFSLASARPGRPSVTRFIQRM